MTHDLSHELKTLRDFIRYALSEFSRHEIYFGHGTDNAWDEALFLCLHPLHIPYDKAEHCLDAILLPQEKNDLLNLITRRIEQRIPAAYLIHTAYFADLKFYVDQRVLIPRSPMAESIEAHFSPWIDEENVSTILDLCTGSGCMAIAAAHAFTDAMIDAVDISQDALDVALINVRQYQLEDQVSLIQSDLFSELNEKRYDIIMSNPPYVDDHDFKTMPKEFHHEPRLGLAAGVDGLEFVEKILRQAKNHLTEHGILITEVGNSQYALMERYPDVPFVWLDFERGGTGVFLLTRRDLEKYF